MAVDLSYEAYLATKKKKPTGSLLYSSTAAAPTFTNTYKAAPVSMPAAKTTSSQKDLSYSAYLSSKTPEKPSPLYSSTAQAPNFNNTLKLQTQSKIPANQSTPQGQRYVAPPEVIKKALYPEVKPAAQSPFKAESAIFRDKPNISKQLTKPVLDKIIAGLGSAIEARSIKPLVAAQKARSRQIAPRRADFKTEEEYKKALLSSPTFNFDPTGSMAVAPMFAGTIRSSSDDIARGIKNLLSSDDLQFADDIARKILSGKVKANDADYTIFRGMFEKFYKIQLPESSKAAATFIRDAIKKSDEVAELAYTSSFKSVGSQATKASLDSPAAIASANAARAKKPVKSFLQMLRDEAGKFLKPTYSKGAIQNPFADKAAGTINRHITSAKQIIQELGDEGIKRGGGMDALLKRTQTNIVDALRHEGDDVMADAVAKLKPASFDDFLTVKRGATVPTPALPTAVRQGESYINTPSGLGQSVQKSLEAPKTALGSQSLPKPSIERGLVTSAKGATTLSPEVKAMAEGQYVPRSSVELMEKAQNLVRDFPEIAERMARSTKTDDVTVAVSSQLIRRLSELGENERAIDIIERLAPKATESGRATQILAYFDKLTPEGVGRFAQRQVDIANEMFPKANLSLTPKQYASFYDKAAEIQKMADGYDKQFATAQLLKSIHDIFPASVASKLGTFQTMAQLLNPKTLIRNLVGNTLFSGLENIKSAVATPVDKFLSLFTGQRTAGLPSLATQGKGFAKGLGQGFKEAKAGVTVGPLSQFDLPQVQVFKGKVLGSLEKTLGMALRAPDKAAYTAAFDDSLRMLMKTNGVKEATPDMLQKAHYDGLYRTFQDDNLISNFFVQTKALLNNVGIKGGEGKTFGLGDLILKYPKTPGALIARGIDYSPAGFINTVFQAAKPLFGKPFDQKTFVDSFSRALIGSAGLVGTGAIMAKLGIITGSPSDDPDVRAIQKQTGQGSYQINASSLKRFVMSGFNAEAARKREGDTLISYDWAQPIAAPLSLGAKLAEGKAEGTMTAITEAIVGGVDTLQEQPLVTGLKTLFGYGDIKSGLISNVQSLPASFVPTALKQINQIADNTQRETYDPNPLNKAVNLAKSKIPGLAQTLPAAIDISGKEREVYQEGSNSLFNVFLNPAFVTQIKTSPDAKMVLDIVEQAGLTAQIPRVVGKKQTVNGESMELTTQQYIELQQFVGKATREVFLQLAETPDFLKLSDEEKVKRLTSALTDIGKLGKVQVLGDSGDFKTLEDIKGKLKMRSTYDQIQELGKQGDQQKIDSILNAMSDEEYELYVKARTTARSQNTSTLRGFLERKSPEAVVFLRSLAPKEKERLLENMTDEEYAIYRELKNKI